MSAPVGIIYPPPDLRSIVDKTATFVAKNGSAFEAKIMNEQRGKPRFSFLLSNDPFNAYYKHKVNELRNSLLFGSQSENQVKQSLPDDSQAPKPVRSSTADRILSNDNETKHSDHSNDASEEGKQEPNCDIKESRDLEDEVIEVNQVKPELNEYIQEKTLKLEEPPPLNHIASPTSNISHLESDIIKLTSQFIATYGRSFLLELVSREQNNSLFDFLKPQHGQFPYMTNLIMQYALIQNPPLDVLEHLERDSTDQKHVLERIKKRAEWNRMLEIERKRREEAEQREKDLYNQIDWHDFVIVETVDYQPGDKGEYPPTTADQVGTRLLKQQRLEDHANPEEMDIDMDTDSNPESLGNGSNEAEFAAPLPPDSSKINIRRDYDPKAAIRSTSLSDNYYVSPITNERIPVDKIHEHFRYNLADPKYLEKKEQVLQGKLAEENVLASGSQIQDSLKNLAQRRTDIFGTNDAEAAIGQKIGEDEEDDRTKNDEKIIWDGHKSSLKRKKLN